MKKKRRRRIQQALSIFFLILLLLGLARFARAQSLPPQYSNSVEILSR